MATRKFIDIGANLTDRMFTGIYNGSQKHASDIDFVLKRAFNAGLEKIIVTAGCREDVAASKSLCSIDSRLFYTTGCHPTRCQEFHQNPFEYYNFIKKDIEEDGNRIVAIGECGLDYDREQFCPRDIQKKYFAQQLKLATETKLPLFLHCRNAYSDFCSILKKHIDEFGRVSGVVHTFDGTTEQALELIELGFYIGFNGCSLKTAENLQVVVSIPDNRILFETDAPWCDIRPTHAGFQYVKTKYDKKKPNKWDMMCMVAGRNEPANIVQVLEVVAGARSQCEDELAAVVYANTLKVFPGLAVQ